MDRIPDKPEPVTTPAAARYFRRSQGTIRCWATRYQARKLGSYKGRTVYDLADLATIESHLHRGRPVPETPEARDAYRAQLMNAAA